MAQRLLPPDWRMLKDDGTGPVTDGVIVPKLAGTGTTTPVWYDKDLTQPTGAGVSSISCDAYGYPTAGGNEVAIWGADDVNYDLQVSGTNYNGGATRTLEDVGVAESSTATAANIRANDADKIIETDAAWSSVETVALTDAVTVAVDFDAGINFTLTLGGNRTLGQPSNQKVGQSGFIRIVQDGTGSRTLAYHADWKFPGGTDPTLSTALGTTDVLFYQVLAANFIYATLARAVA